MNAQPTTAGYPSARLRGWLRFILHLSPFGALVLGITAGRHLAPVIGSWVTDWLPLPLVCLVTITAGIADSMLKWKEQRGSSYPHFSKLGADILCFGMAQLMLVPALCFVVFFLLMSPR